MDKSELAQLNEWINKSPHIALRELKKPKYRSIFTEVEHIFTQKAQLPISAAHLLEQKMIRGDFRSMRLPPYRPKERFPFTPADYLREQDRRHRYKSACWEMDRLRTQCLRQKAQGWSTAEILLQFRVETNQGGRK